MIRFAVLNKVSAGFNKAKSNIVRFTFTAQSFDPIKIAWSCAVIIFTAADNLLNLSVSEILLNAESYYKRGAHNPFMFEW